MASKSGRFYLIFASLVGVAAIAAAVAWRSHQAPAGQPAASARPNVLLISLDTTRADHLRCYGYSRATSANLDQLARRGVRFAHARSQAPWTLASHMALFTSLVPSHHRVNALSAVLSPEIPTLAELLHGNGYHTAGIVNDAQMKALWGYQRGFDFWKEIPVGKVESDCAHITDRALEWLQQAPPEPFFLFLHYFDAHDPYDPPEELRGQFGSSLAGKECSRILHRYRYPNFPIRDQDRLQQIIGSYDGAIAWLDGELGRLFASLPPNTLVVVFSDHGEAFKEHGWTLHMGTLYEEDIHVVLLMSLPGVLPEGLAVPGPVMLIDVAPTVLGLCGVAGPKHHEGLDLQPSWNGQPLPERPILSENTAAVSSSLEGLGLKMVALDDWKLIRSLFDGHEELYRLPDEQTDLAGKETPMRSALSAVARRWIDEEDFWIVYAHGPGKFTASVVPERGEVRNFVAAPTGNWPDPTSKDPPSWEYDPESRYLRWIRSPGEETRGLFFQVSPSDARVRLDVQIDGKPAPDKVFAGSAGTHPSQVPFDLDLDGAFSSPVIERPFRADQPGFYIFHHRSGRAGKFPELSGTLDEQTIRQLRTLGYLR